jgi:hypothetical protein
MAELTINKYSKKPNALFTVICSWPVVEPKLATTLLDRLSVMIYLKRY